MSLHGLSHDAWNRYGKGGQWDYRIIAPGYKYNLTDVAAAIGIHQLARAELMRQQRERIATIYTDELERCDALECPPSPANRVHAWHLYPIRLRLDRLRIGRNEFIEELRGAGVGCSVHWRPLHLHPYYQERFDTTEGTCPTATEMFGRLISLPLFPAMTDMEIAHVVAAVTHVAERFARA
jgi:perosamine synthetase